MAELAAIGLAANVLQFIDAGYSITSSATEVYRSVLGMSAETSNRLATITDLEQISTQLQSTSSTVPRHESLRELSSKCHALSRELIDILKSLRAKKKGSILESFRVGAKFWWNRSKIESIHKCLDDYRAQIQLELTVLFTNDQGSLGRELQSLIGTTGEIQNEVRALRTFLESQRTSGSIDGAIRAIRDELLGFSDAVRRAKCERAILQALHFEKMEERFDDIKPEHNRTFSWIFNGAGSETQREDKPPFNVCFTEWLRSGSGIFHIEGKAGSGKSTLMKFLCDNPQTMDILRSWAGEKQLVFAKFFFWKSGTPMQRSLKGLTQALLHTILKQAPGLIESTFPNEYRQMYDKPWDLPCDKEIRIPYEEIQSQFEQLLASEPVCQSRRFCFFIDGLDEFDEFNGQDDNFMIYQKFVEKLSTWAATRVDVKICVSSRDWNLFRNVLDEAIPGSPSRRLLLQELTRDDMILTVKDTLKDAIGFYDTEPQLVRLADKIVERAEGVFLWVTLVLKSLLRGKQFDDSPKMLRKRLDELPTGLEDFFKFMMNSIEKPYRKLAALIFSVMLTIRKMSSDMDISPLMCSFFEDYEDNSDFIFRGNMSDEDLQRRIEHMRSQLVTCCKGLLEVRKATTESKELSDLLDYRVVFLHRSVSEFFESRFHPAEDTEIHSRVRELMTDKTSQASMLRLICLSFLSEMASVRTRHIKCLTSRRAGAIVSGLVQGFHEVYQGGQPLDFDMIDCLDLALQSPDASPNRPFGLVRERFGCMWVSKIEGTRGFVFDIFGTFALYGFKEIITPILEYSDSRTIHKRLHYVLEGALSGLFSILLPRNRPDRLEGLPTDISIYLDFIGQLLQQTNSDFWQGDLTDHQSLLEMICTRFGGSDTESDSE
ncbi:hypothetical protein F5Y04DRAFT_242934 [Hypomontagnella monticulosa]|nr:hypothetical protein F5Y04DRAFT_242934 [Hypomontagnella monticulosa]